MKKKAGLDRRLLYWGLLAGFPGTALALLLLWAGDFSSKLQWTLTLFLLCFWLGFVWAARERLVFSLRTLANLLAALREGDFSLRARGASLDHAMGEVLLEVNALGDTLRGQRLAALEATSLLRKVMEEIEVAVFAFDGQKRLRLVNPAGQRLLTQPLERVLGSTAAELGLEDCLGGEAYQTIEAAFPGGSGRWGLRRSTFREGGLPHELLVLADLSRPLREEERLAWQRLVRVLGHELNNSLAPIKSIAGSLDNLLLREPLPTDWRADVRDGLRVIASRAEALSRFTEAYARLARLPPPHLTTVRVGEWIHRVAQLETRLAVAIHDGPELAIRADGDQLDQLLINLLRNAVDAALETGGGVELGWARNSSYLLLWIHDEGPGISNPANLFVPFFTTKPGGSGIGLILSRQIAEAHGGNLTVENCTAARGCRAQLRLPLQGGAN
jgi:nitrogen fixation/metabolism regulation signal transduction histidine kinase